jgi:hypothetical protein
MLTASLPNVPFLSFLNCNMAVMQCSALLAGVIIEIVRFSEKYSRLSFGVEDSLDVLRREELLHRYRPHPVADTLEEHKRLPLELSALNTRDKPDIRSLCLAGNR